MGIPHSPQEAAPAYDEVFHDHPVNRFTPSGSASAVRHHFTCRYFTLCQGMGIDRRQYTTVPQSDDIELHAHTHDPSSSEPSQSPETLTQTITNILRPKPQAHVHCEACDVQTAARQRRENEKYCCTMVATTFMMFFVVCGTVLGIVIVRAHVNARGVRHEG
jgi:hypothetical protein